MGLPPYQRLNYNRCIQLTGGYMSVYRYRIIRLPEVKNTTGLAKSTIYKKVAAKEFPKPISLGGKAVGWIENEIQNWISERIKDAANDN